MPEMTDAMYCHQQICIPPTFPYLLRQYAKAAIRSQPTDLLRWSCSYFRALSLGLRPAVKLRLEYPIPQSQFGLTPGWLKTLLYQLYGYQFISWPQIFERWKGICLQILGLKQIILLAGFNDPSHMPWLRFVAVAAGFLTTNLTNTMILICELLTEEPEGGSSSIPYGIFADLYKFLAAIDACETHEIRNFWFTESNLDLTKVEQVTVTPTERFDELERSLISEEVVEEEELQDKFSDLQRYLKTIETDQTEEEMEETPKVLEEPVVETAPTMPEPHCYVILDPEDGKICTSEHSKAETSSSGTSTESLVLAGSSEEIQPEEQTTMISFASVQQTSEESKPMTISSSTMSSEPAPEVEIITIEAVPGIGGIVKPEIVEMALIYLKEAANRQKGMVMPRNIKHFLCPPLEECFD